MRERLVLLLVVLGAAACAEVGRPPGGPIDETPPALVAVLPGSLAVGVARDQPLQFVFSEKVERRGFARAVTLIPDVPLRRPSFDGESVQLAPRNGWPADSAVVWVLSPSLRDAHGVVLGEEIRGIFTTADALPPGRITGNATVDSLVRGDPDWQALRAELTLPPDEGQRRRKLWRTAQGSQGGAFEIPWLDLPSGPFRLEVYLDANGNARRDDREPVATVDSLFLTIADTMLRVEDERLRLIDLEGPVPVQVCLTERLDDSLSVALWTRHEDAERTARASIDSTACAILDLVPGRTVVGGWLDLDGDGKFGPDSTGVMEPFLVPDTLEVAPAEPVRFEIPWPANRAPFDAVDSLRTPPVPKELWSVGG